MDSTGIKSARLAAIAALPDTMQDHALVDWPTVKALCNFSDTTHARRIITEAGVPLTEISPRRKLPTWGRLRAFLASRERGGEPHCRLEQQT
jgi:hypothetical protein